MNHNDWLPFLRTIRRENMILRKRAGFLLFIALVILFSATSLAEYEQYRLTEPYELYTGPYTTVYPIDSHNVIVRMAPPEAVPWRVEWYRDGRVIRTLEASGDYDSVRGRPGNREISAAERESPMDGQRSVVYHANGRTSAGSPVRQSDRLL